MDKDTGGPIKDDVKILGVCGSLQAESQNLSLLRMVGERLGAERFRLFDGIRDLPLFNPDLEEPAAVLTWREAIRSSDALFIASPEYGHSLPGALKNAIDWVIGTGELENKVIAVTASSNHPERGRKGLEAILVTLGAVKAVIVGGEPTVRGAAYEARLDELVQKLVETIERISPPAA